MEHNGKNQSPYKGLTWSLFFMIIVPVLLYLLVFGAAKGIAGAKMSTKECNLIGLMFGFGCGFLFHLSLIIAGLITESFKVVCVRIGHFFQNLRVSGKFAFKYYWFELKDTGYVFWFYFIAIVTVILVTVLSIVKYYQLFM